jgi:hypothetical protein
MAIGIATVVALASLSACGGDPAPVFAQAFGFHCDKHDSPLARTACQKSGDPGGAKVSRYCYRTLANPNCFDRPDPDSKNQALGSSGY